MNIPTYPTQPLLPSHVLPLTWANPTQAWFTAHRPTPAAATIIVGDEPEHAPWVASLHAKYCAWTCTHDDLDDCWSAYHGHDATDVPVKADGMEGYA